MTMDALEYVRGKGEFDVVIVDSTDPVDFAEGLFREPFTETSIERSMRRDLSRPRPNLPLLILTY